jgi:C-terminal processing protease CtpA/Prc
MGGRSRCCFCLALTFSLSFCGEAWSQGLSKLDRDRAQDMLQVVAADVSKHYYDPKFHGVDWDAKVREARQKIDRESSLGMAFSHIAAAVGNLNDSHTFFVPPQRPYRYDYGWQFEMIRDRCFVTQVRPGSDAETKGLKPGDEVLEINGYTPTRENLWKMEYVYRILRPQTELTLALRDPAGRERQLEVVTKFHQLTRVQDLTGEGVWALIRQNENLQQLMRARSGDFDGELMILKLPNFILTQSLVEDLIGKARKHRALIIDLRGNPGGAVDTLKYLVGGVFDHEVKIADQVERDKSKPLTAKSMGRNAFTGKLVVLVDSKSASAAELFARIVQLEKRGMIMGDRSSGSVMEARRYGYRTGQDTVVLYGASITAADLVMSDGRSLEHAGVSPDEVVLPTAADLARGRDPVLAHAAATLGVNLTPEQAGNLFPYEWPADNP